MSFQALSASSNQASRKQTPRCCGAASLTRGRTFPRPVGADHQDGLHGGAASELQAVPAVAERGRADEPVAPADGAGPQAVDEQAARLRRGLDAGPGANSARTVPW